MAYHPHLQGTFGPNNTLYVARRQLQLDEQKLPLPGAGIFTHFSPNLQLTAPNCTRRIWRLPAWLYPTSGKPPLSYHRQMKNWTLDDRSVTLRSAARGQEFVLDSKYYPEAITWAKSLITTNASQSPHLR
jgi:hypothetical protein